MQSAPVTWLTPGFGFAPSDPLAGPNLVATAFQHDAAIAADPQLSAAGFVPPEDESRNPGVILGLTAPRAPRALAREPVPLRPARAVLAARGAGRRRSRRGSRDRPGERPALPAHAQLLERLAGREPARRRRRGPAAVARCPSPVFQCRERPAARRRKCARARPSPCRADARRPGPARAGRHRRRGDRTRVRARCNPGRHAARLRCRKRRRAMDMDPEGAVAAPAGADARCAVDHPQSRHRRRARTAPTGGKRPAPLAPVRPRPRRSTLLRAGSLATGRPTPALDVRAARRAGPGARRPRGDAPSHRGIGPECRRMDRAAAGRLRHALRRARRMPVQARAMRCSSSTRRRDACCGPTTASRPCPRRRARSTSTATASSTAPMSST